MITRIDQGSRMSQAVIHGDTVHLAGQVGTPGESITTQTEEVLAKIEDLLTRSESGKHLMLRATLWLADMADYDQMNIMWDAWVAGINPPARATCGVGPAAPIYKIEIVVTAARE